MAAEMFLSAAISILTEKASDFLVKEFTTALGVDLYRQKLCRILPAVQAIVADAEERGRADPSVRGWLHDLKIIAYEAEDVLDELRYDAISKDVEAEIRSEKKARLSLSLPGSSLLRDAAGSLSDGNKLKDVLEKIEAIVDEMNRFHFLIKDTKKQPVTKIVNRPMSHSYVVESTIIGRSDDLEKIVPIILRQTEREIITVLPIVGIGGLGKTTLTQLIYNNSTIQTHFERKLWVCVSDEFDVPHLAKAIIDVATGTNSQLPIENMELVQQRLREVLIGERYLLVLDDVWNENRDKWEQLRLLLDCGSPGSVVIVTTRSQKVVEIVGTQKAYELQGLNEDDLWGIFKQRAFGAGVHERPRLVDIGKQLMKKCYGSPLVATTLGGLMSYKREEREWLDVLESNIWDHTTVENKIMPVLKLSYESLSPQMKRCFAFCAIYPKDYEMERDCLIKLWMANSYIPLEGNMEVEAKGIEIFNELAWRGFFQNVTKSEFSLHGQRIITCKMHDLLHDLAQSLAGNECAILSKDDRRSDVLSNNTLHASSSCARTIVNLYESSSSIRTMLLTDCDFLEYKNLKTLDLSKANSLRALSLSRSCIREIHAESRMSMHLRYLNLSCCRRLMVLPESLCTLYSLQTLDLSYCHKLLCLPKGMRHMRSLRHVHLIECDLLKCMPAGLGNLRSLQTLTMYIVNPSTGCGIEELKDLNLGGMLELYDLGQLHNHQEARLANLISKKNLTQLVLSWKRMTDTPYLLDPDAALDPDVVRDVLEGLEPSRELEILEIKRYDGIKFSAWMDNSISLRNLSVLVLEECRRCTVLPPIWQLPSLVELYISELNNLKHICTGSPTLAQENGTTLHNMFPMLEKLELRDLASLESWQENDLAEFTTLTFPKLLELKIFNCPRLYALPSCPFLQKLVVYSNQPLSQMLFSAIETLESNGVDVEIHEPSDNKIVKPKKYGPELFLCLSRLMKDGHKCLCIHWSELKRDRLISWWPSSEEVNRALRRIVLGLLSFIIIPLHLKFDKISV